MTTDDQRRGILRSTAERRVPDGGAVSSDLDVGCATFLASDPARAGRRPPRDQDEPNRPVPGEDLLR